MIRTALTACLAVLALLALLALPAAGARALPPSSAQVPLELRPAQGPPGSSTIVHARGFAAYESVRVYLDDVLVEQEGAGGDGAVEAIVPLPDPAGPHRLMLYGQTSARAAAGVFTTTGAGPARPALFVRRPPAGAGRCGPGSSAGRAWGVPGGSGSG